MSVKRRLGTTVGISIAILLYVVMFILGLSFWGLVIYVLLRLSGLVG